MGYCIDGDDEFDVFLSYASADDKAHNHWVRDFEQYLNERVPAELKRNAKADEDRTDLFRICRDETGFPRSGHLAEVIDERVRHSQFLFVFLGSGYLKSDWCLSELDIFRETAGGTLPATLEHVYLIVVDEEAVRALRADGAPAGLTSTKRRRLWGDLQRMANRAVREHGFVREGSLVPVYAEGDRADNHFHKVAQRIVRELVDKLVERRVRTQPAPPPPPPRAAGISPSILIGAVPDRLRAARDELVRILGNTRAQIIEAADFDDEDAVRKRMRLAATLLLPFDRKAPLGGHFLPPGGHLALQRDLFQEIHADRGTDTDAPVIWWEPEPGPDDGTPARAKDHEFFKAIDRLPPEQRHSGSAETLARKLAPPPATKTSVTAKLLIEWQESDEQTINEAKKKVQDEFNTHCARQAQQGIQVNANLRFSVMDWDKLQHGLRKKPDGVVIVYNQNKDIDALMEQGDTITNLEEVARHKLFPGIFYMWPKGKFLPSEEWSFVRFTRSGKDGILAYDPNELRLFVSRLFDVVQRKSLPDAERRAEGKSR